MISFRRRDKYKAFMERCVEGDTAESFIVQAITSINGHYRVTRGVYT